MATLLQIVLINLVVSCDNIGVIALATRNLPYTKAKLARHLGVLLSFLLKLIFIAVMGFLFSVPWLHIRIIGGIMLVYVTFNMLRQSERGSSPNAKGQAGNFLFAIVTIIAADISMSLDNVIAVLSIVSADGQTISSSDMFMVVIGLAVSIPLLLWFSETVSQLMERYAVLTYICAGYLVFIAVRMVCEDATIALFLEYINFNSTFTLAFVSGLFVVATSIFTKAATSHNIAVQRKKLMLVYLFICAYSFVTVALISYLDTGPIVDGVLLNVDMFYGIEPTGVNAIYADRDAVHLFALCGSLIVQIILEPGPGRDEPGGWYVAKVKRCMLGMGILLLLELVICTVGLTVSFGFGQLNLLVYIACFIMQLLLYSTYISIFCMIRTFVRKGPIMVVIAMIFVHVETFLVEASLYHPSWVKYAGFFPTYFFQNLPVGQIEGMVLVKVLLFTAPCIILSTWFGFWRMQTRYSVNLHPEKKAFHLSCK